jgi:hypothetical protein
MSANHSLSYLWWKVTRRQWPTPVLLAIQEAKVRRIAVRSQPRQIVRENLSQKNHHKKGLVKWFKV